MTSKFLFIAISMALVSLAMATAEESNPSQDVKAIAAKAAEAELFGLESDRPGKCGGIEAVCYRNGDCCSNRCIKRYRFNYGHCL